MEPEGRKKRVLGQLLSYRLEFGGAYRCLKRASPSLVAVLGDSGKRKVILLGRDCTPQETENELATPFAVPSSPKVKTGPLMILTPCFFFRASLAFLALQH